MEKFGTIIVLIWSIVWLVCSVPRRKNNESIKTFHNGEAIAADDLIRKYEMEHQKFYTESDKDGGYLVWPALDNKNIDNYCKRYLKKCIPTRATDDAFGNKIKKVIHYKKENMKTTGEVVIVKCKFMYKSHRSTYYMTRAPEPNCVYSLKSTGNWIYFILTIINKYCDFEKYPFTDISLKRKMVDIVYKKHHKTGQLIANHADLVKFELEHMELSRREGCYAATFGLTNSLVTMERQKRQFNENGLVYEYLTASVCVTRTGFLGRCLAVDQCYQLYELRQLPNRYQYPIIDACNRGMQVTGTCCSGTLSQFKEIEPLALGYNNLFDSWPFWVPVSQWPPSIPAQPAFPPPFGFPAPLPAPPTPPPPPPSWPQSPEPTTSKPVATLGSVNISSISYTGCGIKNGPQEQERIVGGHDAELGEWPWMAALVNRGMLFCGGSLIDGTHILTAAHCVARMNPWDVAQLKVHLGDYNIKSKNDIQHIEKKVARVVWHRGFNPQTLYNDVALLVLDSPVQFSKYVRPICLSQLRLEYSRKMGTVIGWGSIKEMGPTSAVLQEVNVPIWTNQDCDFKYGSAAPGGIIDSFVCAGRSSQDSCTGDSGGPLMVNEGKKWQQVGIVSWGIGCGKGQFPGVYTRISSFMHWIGKNLNI